MHAQNIHGVDSSLSSSVGSNSHGFIAVSSDVAEEAGAIVHFRSASVSEASLRAAIAAAGLDEKRIPKLPSAAEALRRAVDEQRGRRRLARPLDGGGWAIVDEHVEKGVPSAYSLELSVRVDVAGELFFLPAEPSTMTNDITSAYVRHRQQYAATDLSKWIVGLAEAHDAVSPRREGGFYFIPKARLESFRAWATAIAAASGAKIFFIPAMKSDEAIEAILDAITREAESEAELMETELGMNATPVADDAADAADATSPELGKRAIKTRQTKLGALGDKLGVYEALLGVQLDVIRERLERVRAGLTVAALAAEAEAAE